jgi:triosephosphate isomerase
VAEALSRTSIQVGAQNVHWEASGAHTGEVAPGMLAGGGHAVAVSIEGYALEGRLPV